MKNVYIDAVLFKLNQRTKALQAISEQLAYACILDGSKKPEAINAQRAVAASEWAASTIRVLGDKMVESDNICTIGHELIEALNPIQADSRATAMRFALEATAPLAGESHWTWARDQAADELFRERAIAEAIGFADLAVKDFLSSHGLRTA